MSEQRSNYRNIIKTTSILGGAQVIQMLVSVIRGKFVALLLGPVGMGINSLLNSALLLMVQCTGLGVDFSGVREISRANEEGDIEKLSRTFTIFKRWSYLSAIAGSIIVVLIAPLLSLISFDSFQYIVAFMLLGVALFFARVQQMNATIIQGVRQFGSLAKASLIGSIVASTTAIPMYYLLGTNGIVPAIILSYASMWVVNAWFAKKIRARIDTSIPLKQSLKEGVPMVQFGVASMLTGLLPTLSIYLVNSFINNYGTLADVGLYAAGTAITTQYVGVIFTAMSTEYYPRLSTICHDVSQTNNAVNQQAEIVTLIVAPLMVIMMITAPLIIKVLLSSEFVSIREFIIYLAFGTFFRAASYTVGFISFAKGDKKFFVYWEGVANSIFILVYNIVGYVIGGLNGMAIAFAFGYFTYFVLITIIAGRRYGFKFETEYWKIFVTLLILCSAMLATTILFTGIWLYSLGSLIVVSSVAYCYRELNRRLDIKALVNKLLKR